jgi:glucose/arabinose dehydrogenase
VGIGSSCNSCLETDESMAAISVIDPAGWSRRVFAHGLRNPLGFDWHPETGQMWAADHGSDWLGDEVPPDELNLQARSGSIEVACSAWSALRVRSARQNSAMAALR